MKKTITLLLAAAGVAMAEVTPLTLQWEDGYAASPQGAKYNEYAEGMYNTVTLVVDLNWDALLTDESTETPIFSANAANGKYIGMGLFVGNSKYLDAWINDVDEVDTISFKYSAIDNFRSYTDAAFVFTSYDFKEGKSYFEAYLYLSADNGETYTLELRTNPKKTTACDNGGFDTIASFSYDSEYVNKMDVYDTYLMPSEHLEAISKLNTASVPEPTTATLSLLALAGLAARRRRR